METFVFIKKYLVEMGIDDPLNRSSSLIAKNYIIIIVSILCMTTNIVYFFHDATEFEDYVDLIYAFSTAALCFVVYVIMIWKRRNVFESINGFEQLINSSKYTSS